MKWRKGFLSAAILLICAVLAACTCPDLQEVEETCNSIHSCNNPETAHCKCDELCSFFNDCCLDPRQWQKPHPIVHGLSCMKTDREPMIVLGHCHESFQGSEIIRNLCEHNLPFDPINQIPVTSKASGYTYKNLFCAICHSDHLTTYYWNTTLHLDSQVDKSKFSRETIFDTLKYVNKWGNYLQDVSGNYTLHPVELKPHKPENIYARSCQLDLVSQCPNTWEDEDMANKCRSYLSPVYHGSKGYRNIHCAQCNGISNGCNLSCQPPQIQQDPSKEEGILLDFDGPLFKDESCGEFAIFDRFFNLCRDRRCAIPHYIYDGDQGCTIGHMDASNRHRFNIYYVGLQAAADEISAKEEEAKYSHLAQDFLDCVKIELPADTYQVMKNQSVYIPNYNVTLDASHYSIQDDTLYICYDILDQMKNHSNITEYEESFPFYMEYLSSFGLWLSITCLILHIVAFGFVKEMRNLPGMNLVSLSTVLLASYCIFFLVYYFKPGETGCFVVGVSMYYCFMVAFFWMSVISFDVWRSLYMATTSLRFIGAQNKMRRFTIYSFYSWIIPIIFVVVALTIDNNMDIPEIYRPQFGAHICWFSQKRALFFFFALPFTIIVTINVIFYILSARIIIRNCKRMSQNDMSSHKRNFKLYLNLAIIMGITWTTGIIGAVTSIDAFWVVFILLNTLQGVFIFIGFTCLNSSAKKVFNDTLKRKFSSSVVQTSTTFSYSTAK